MARTTRTTKGSNRTSKAKAEKEFKVNDNVILTCYEWEEECTTKLVILNAFTIYGKIRETRDHMFFMSYPSIKTKKGDFKNQAFCFDKSMMEAINSYVDEFMTEE